MTDQMKSYQMLAEARQCAMRNASATSGYEREAYDIQANTLLRQMNELLGRMSADECAECLRWTGELAAVRDAS